MTPEFCANSAGFQFITQQGWTWKQGTKPNIEIEICPVCKKNSFGHFYMECHNPDSSQKQRDGLWICMKCGASGNLYSLKQKLGLVNTDVSSQKDWAASQKKVDILPDVDKCHEALLADGDALDYLMNIRGFSKDIIKQQKLGLTKHYFKTTGEVRALVYPYLLNGNQIWVHYRTLPDPNNLSKVPKDFASPAGWDATLYNIGVLTPDIKELVMVEGEANCIAALDKGILDICGVPGANVRKAEWIDKLDTVEKVYICYDTDKVGQRAAQVIASKVGIEKCYKIILPTFDVVSESGETKKGKDLNEWFLNGGTKEAFEQLKLEAKLFDVDGVTNSSDALEEFEEELEGKGAGQKYVWPMVGDIIQFDEGDCVHILAEEKVGKFLRNDQLVKTEHGWTEIGNLEVGDRLASIDGEPSTVIGVFPQGVQELFEITFSDGRKTIAGHDHLWKVANVNKPDVWSIYTTDAILNEYSHNKNTGALYKELYVPLISGEFGHYVPYIDPWLLGVLIGDGDVSGVTPALTTNDSEIMYKVAQTVQQYGLSLNLVKNTTNQFLISTLGENGRLSDSNYLSHELRAMGLRGKTCENKFIPTQYFESSKQDRLALLQGLLDTDGTAGKNGSISYCTVSKQLAWDVQYLVRSLGGIATISEPKTKRFRYKGELRTGQPAYIVGIRLPEREVAFTLTRKLQRVPARINQPRLVITHIRRVENAEATCIAVSHPSKLFITEDFIVTHNTKFAMNLLEYMVGAYDENGVNICLEMTRAKQARMWVSHKSGVADNIPKTPEEAKCLTDQFKAIIPVVKDMVANRKGELFFCSPKYHSADDIYKLIIDCIRRYGVKWIVLDNLQRLCDTTIGGKNRTQYLSEISKRLSQICKEYLVQIVLILQPNRVSENKLTAVSNVDGASQVAKDCDGLLILNSNKVGEISKDMLAQGGFIQTEGTFSPEVLVTAALSRYSAGGSTMLYFDRATSTVYKLTEGKIAAMTAKASAGIGYTEQAKAMNMPLDTLKDVVNTDIIV